MGLFDLEKHFAFYGAYHSNPINVLIHMVFVWPIAFSLSVLLYFTPSIFNFLPQIHFSLLGNDFHLIFNLGFCLTLVYCLFYISFDIKAGSLAALMILGCWIGGSAVAVKLGYSLAWKVVLASQIFCWAAQFIGHGVFEKRAPALLDNLSQAFLMAPFFVLLEALHMCCGYEPYPGFYTSVQVKVDAEKQQLEAKKLKKVT
ncbi:hypothetical protein MKW92_029649 [Papaver armeniacum]|nr:hypothetical protein MKW92_029649 [Papaver armeniacum]